MTFPYRKGPWQVLDSEIKYQNPWITVREDQVIRPDGKDGIFGVVDMLPGVSVLAVDSDGYAYLVKEYQYGVEKETLEVISGGYAEGEERLAAVHRELKEEAGITAEEIISLGRIDPFTSVVNSANYLYLAQGLEFGESEPEGTEVIEIIKVPYQQALAWAMDSTITHGASAATILKARDYLLAEK